MGSTGVAASFAFVAGLGGAVQIAAQGRLGDRIGSLEALACAFGVGGATALVVLLIAGQFSLATAIDRFGWLGFEQVPLAWPRLLGLALLAAGAALTLKR